MNRLVIVGNGFDLAHGLKTRYEDFLLDYLIKHIKNLEINLDKGSIDNLIEVNYVDNCRLFNGEKVTDLFDELSLNKLLESEYLSIQNKWKKRNGYHDYGVTIENSGIKFISIRIKSRLFGELISERKWTDIEKTYFDILLEVFKESKDKKSFNNEYTINKLNTDFDFLKRKIIEYLNLVNKPLLDADTRKYENLSLFKVIDKCYTPPDLKYLERFFSKEIYEKIPDLEKIFLVNFNYTRLFEDYVFGTTKLSEKQIEKTIYYSIHGSLVFPENIIFGYGDDSNKHYQDLEDEDNEEYLKNIKSFYYPNDSHYIDLINALYEQEFDVFVFGHSLGLSDRVLLKTIFEHDNCKAIKLFHRGSKESQFSKRIALSRHFTDKIKMRSKIVDYSDEDVM